MNSRPVLLAFLFVCLLLSAVSYGQEKQEDPYADYSYLWEEADKKKKKKKDKNAPTEESIPQPDPELAPATTTPAAPVPRPQLTLDSASLRQEPAIAADSLSQPEPTDTIPEEDPPLSSAELTDQLAEENDVVKPEGGSNRGKNDFRAGLPSASGGNRINAGLTYTNIGGQNFVGLTLSPEFTFGKVGIGLNVPILYGLDDNEVRTEIFEDGVGPARLIRYMRYGAQKRDPVYFRLGELDNVSIGFGGLVNNYTNTTSFEKRKLGLHYDVNYRGIAGIEGLYSDFDPGSFNLFAIRPYVRPLVTLGLPIASTLEIGFTYVRDKDQTDIPISESETLNYTFTEPGIGAFSIDAGITVLQSPFLQIDLFGGFNKLDVSSEPFNELANDVAETPGITGAASDNFEDGSGVNVGVNFRFHFIADILDTDVRIERLQYQDHYIPQFFDAAYELNKDGKILALLTADKQGGIYGSLTGHILKKIRLGGSLLIPDDISVSSPAFVRVHADLERLFDKFSLHASYTKGGLDDLGDAFKLDDRSLAKVRFTYFMNSFLTTGVDYYWAFALDENGSYRATGFVSPFIGVSIQF